MKRKNIPCKSLTKKFDYQNDNRIYSLLHSTYYSICVQGIVSAANSISLRLSLHVAYF